MPRTSRSPLMNAIHVLMALSIEERAHVNEIVNTFGPNNPPRLDRSTELEEADEETTEAPVKKAKKKAKAKKATKTASKPAPAKAKAKPAKKKKAKPEPEEDEDEEETEDDDDTTLADDDEDDDN